MLQYGQVQRETDGKNVPEGTLCHNSGKKKGGRLLQ
jgi:hypothetical protein